ncbi:MAG: acetyltransferase [Chitinophagales bacterium]
MQKVLIIGSSGHAKVVIDIFERSGVYEIVGLIDTFKPEGEKTLAYSILGKEEQIPMLLKAHPDAHIFIAIGNNAHRKAMQEKISGIAPEVKYANAVHPFSSVASEVQLGRGIAIMPGAVINSGCVLEDHVIINTRASLDHDGYMEKFSSLAPGVTTGGNVHIGACSAISIGATIKHGVHIGAHTVIGAGALVLEDCFDHRVYYGVPAREIRMREEAEQYLS